MQKQLIYTILAIMSLAIGRQFLKFYNGSDPITGAKDVAPGHVLIFLGSVILVCQLVMVIRNVVDMIRESKERT